METVIKAVSEAGLGLGSLIIMAFLFVYQLKTNAKMMDKLGNSIDLNSEVTRGLVAKIDESIRTDRDVVDAVNYCRAQNLAKSKR